MYETIGLIIIAATLSSCAVGSITSGYSLRAYEADSLTGNAEDHLYQRLKSRIESDKIIEQARKMEKVC